MPDFSVWVYFTAFEMEQSLRVMFSVQGNAVSAEVSLHASRIIACKKLCWDLAGQGKAECR